MVKILLVEDTLAVRLLIAEVLAEGGYDVTEAGNGREALQHLDKASFDLMITDVLMPEMDGIELIKEARRRQPKTKILAISGGAPDLPAAFALKLSEMFTADAVLYKPFLNEELRGSVSRLVG